MTYQETIAALQRMGTPQNVKIYRRHGAGDNLFGVSFANLNKLKKQIKVDHPLAEQLWATGNADARTLALMIADPDAFTPASADAWLRDISYYLLADLYGGLIARSKFAQGRMKKWMKSKQEYVRHCGYAVLGATLRDDPAQVDDAFCESVLQTIERQIHASPNRARHGMNMALVAIGIYKPHLRETAIAAARRIGRVEVDHGETSCQTPDAEAYILKAAARKPPKRKTQRA